MTDILDRARFSRLIVVLLLLAVLVIEDHAGGGPGGPRSSGAGRRRRRQPGVIGGDGGRRRLLLGCAGRLPTRQRREQRRLRLCRRRDKARRPTSRPMTAPRVTPSRCKSPSIPARSATDSCCRSSSPSPTIRRNSIARVPTPARSTGQRSSRPTLNRPLWRRRTSHSSIGPTRSRSRSSPRSRWTGTFYTAEKYHQDFLVRNPTLPVHRLQRPAEDCESQALVSGPAFARRQCWSADE